VAVIIPAYNEESSISQVVELIPEWVDEVVVVDNGSTDDTAAAAERSGRCRVVQEPRRGYGSACLAGIAALGEAEVIVTLDADLSDYPGRMALLVDPILEGGSDFVLGSRTLGNAEPGAFPPQARFGNLLACTLMRLFWNAPYTDLGPFRAISRQALERLEMQDRNYGWTIEMQLKALFQGLSVREVPIDYRRRIGKSKVTGTIRGVVGAGTKILYLIFREAWRRWPKGRIKSAT